VFFFFVALRSYEGIIRVANGENPVNAPRTNGQRRHERSSLSAKTRGLLILRYQVRRTRSDAGLNLGEKLVPLELFLWEGVREATC
jgi:hypothetical protein